MPRRSHGASRQGCASRLLFLLTQGVAPKSFYLRWLVYFRGELLGEVLAATEPAARLRAVHRFRIKREDQQELEVRRAT